MEGCWRNHRVIEETLSQAYAPLGDNNVTCKVLMIPLYAYFSSITEAVNNTLDV